MKIQEVIFFLFFVCVLDKDAAAQRSGKEGACKDKAPVNITCHGRKRLIPPGNSESVSAEQDPGKKCKSSDQEGPVVSSEVIKKCIVYFLCLIFETVISSFQPFG